MVFLDCSLRALNQNFSGKESLCKDLSLKTKDKGSLNLEANDHIQITNSLEPFP